MFVVDPAMLDHAGPPRVTFMLACLSSLRERYRDLGSDLEIGVGDPANVLPAVADRYGATEVGWNADHSGVSRERDAAVRSSLRADGLAVTTSEDLYLHPPGSITTNAGDPYQVFSYFWDKWTAREPDSPHPSPSPTDLHPVSGAELPTRRELDCPPPEADVPPGGIEAGTERLARFCAEAIYAYEADRDRPAANATSRLSPHLKWGTLGIRTVRETVDRARAEAPDQPAADSCAAFARQLAWRDFYGHVLAEWPDIVSTDYRSYERPIQWRSDPDGVRAWKDGMTGFPIVDAGMRQLRREAFMHNRVRMIVASFLTKDLLVDWRTGYAWFRERLVDHDTANDVGGWQWAAGTGTDAQPYFRIFNPTIQGERYDPDADYIRTYVPELEDVPTDVIHGWNDLDAADRADATPDYPAPILDHASRREEAIELFEAARGD